MRKKIVKSPAVLFAFIAALFLAGTNSAQSVNVSYPTPILTNEIEGTIKARDIGDARLTSYYFTFLANQGDVFINIVTKNFNGDIDVFLAEGLKPLTKVVVYADMSDNETGRVLYFRKSERLILRVEGRTPNDDPATFRIKFAGSFEASKDAPTEEPALPDLKAANDTGIRVNSVGTIVAAAPKQKPTPEPTGTVAENEKPGDTETVPSQAENEPTGAAKEKKVEVVVTDPTAAAEEPARTTAKAPAERRRGKGLRSRSRTSAAAKVPAPPRRRPPAKAPEAEPDPLKSIFLLIEFKNGGKIERPMSEVLRMTVDKGILTVISRDGTIGRYSIFDIVKTTIQ
jgi:hypothetical protein